MQSLESWCSVSVTFLSRAVVLMVIQEHQMQPVHIQLRLPFESCFCHRQRPKLALHCSYQKVQVGHDRIRRLGNWGSSTSMSLSSAAARHNRRTQDVILLVSTWSKYAILPSWSRIQRMLLGTRLVTTCFRKFTSAAKIAPGTKFASLQQPHSQSATSHAMA